ncbi:substrate-binding periplasmic protein [Magnetococcus sp. PR-3]|uniref:substrate-binding periplasmic protein n=1 Tax=Magnetococcus sp. PR-3 TaxID=3120355 RepID=UPI002FCE3D1D
MARGWQKQIGLFLLAGLGLVLSAGEPAHADVIRFVTYPSVSFINPETGQVDGPVAALVRAINAELGQKIEFDFVPLPRMLMVLEKGGAEAAFNMSHNEARNKKWYYSHPMHVVDYGVFVGKDNPLNYTHKGQMQGYTIATYGPTNLSKKVERFAKDIPGSSVLVENSFKDVFRMLNAGRFGKKGLVYAPDVIGLGAMEQLGLNHIRYAGSDQKNLYHVVFVKSLVKRSYVDAFNRLLLKYHADGSMAEIYGRYTKPPTARVPSATDVRLDWDKRAPEERP